MLPAMSHPYRGLPDSAFWRRAVAGLPEDEVDPVVAAPFTIGRETPIATCGSCFAQHISRVLSRRGYTYLVTEPAPEGDPDPESYGVFPARTGNIYTVRQLLQTFTRAYSLFHPADTAWRRKDGAFVDPFRPQVRASGFETVEALEADRKRHLAAVRAMFEDCEVFVFTLGLTEAWVSARDGAVFPLAPGVAGGEPGPDYAFHNMDVDEMVRDLSDFIRRLRVVNPGVRLILTVSPVPLVATYAPAHVLTATTYSKAALRVVADMAARLLPEVCYFPSYEIITGPQARGRYFADDLRSVTDEGVERVMGVFGRHFLGETASAPARARPTAAALSDADRERLRELSEVICDEEALDV
jgi:hypothetical protein